MISQIAANSQTSMVELKTGLSLYTVELGNPVGPMLILHRWGPADNEEHRLDILNEEFRIIYFHQSRSHQMGSRLWRYALGLAYAAKYFGSTISGLVLRGLWLIREQDLDHDYGDGKNGKCIILRSVGSSCDTRHELIWKDWKKL